MSIIDQLVAFIAEISKYVPLVDVIIRILGIFGIAF